jgi:hypothetical protein
MQKEKNDTNYLQLFNFTDEEMTKLDGLVKTKRFEAKRNEVIYPTTIVQKLKFLIYSLRLLEHVANQLKFRGLDAPLLKEPEIENNDSGYVEVDLDLFYNKIILILKEYSPLRHSVETLIHKYEMGVSFRKHNLERQILLAFLESQENIESMIDFIYSLGRVVPQVNPDETMAIER